MTDLDDDLFEPSEDPLPPVFTATYDCECSEGDYIEAGEQIRADGQGGWVHADGKCDGTDFL